MGFCVRRCHRVVFGLDKIARRVAADGVRVSAPSAERGSQFMPFAALKGFEDVVAGVEEAAGRDCG